MDGGTAREAEVAATARWRAAEDRLYPIAMSDPDGYRGGLDAVHAVLEELRRSTATVAELIAAEQAPARFTAALPAGSVLPVDLLVQAACGIRGRELAAAREGDRRAAAVADARAAGRSWAVLEGPERIEELIGVAGGRAVATHLPSGRTLLAALDPYAGTDPFRLQEFGADGGSAREQDFADGAAWSAACDRWRAEIESA